MKRIQLANSSKFALVDDEMYDELSQWSWFDNGKYASRKPNGHIIKMHHLVLPKKEGYDVDHINRNSYDNQRANLRHATRSQNLLNRTTQRTGEYLGVSFNPLKKLYIATIKIAGKTRTLGKFKQPHRAALMRDFWASFIHGKDAVLNLPLVSVSEETLSSPAEV
jgi:hypothetical protein